MTSRIACDTPDSGPENEVGARIKTHLRSILLTLRQTIPEEQRRAFNDVIGAQVIDWATTLAKDHPEVVIGVYWPIRNEPDLRPTYAALIAQGVRLALPVVMGKDMPLRFIRWTPGDAMQKDSFGVAVPADGAIVSPQALLIPCVGFNRQRLRLGYGGGFYDRTLAVDPRPITAGIAYASGLVAFDGAAHDIALDLILTETGRI